MADPVLQSAEPTITDPPPVSAEKVMSAFDKRFPKPASDAEPFEPVTDPVKPEVVKEPAKAPVIAKPDEIPDDIGKLSVADRKDKWKQFNAAYKERGKKLDDLTAQLADFEGTRKERDDLKTSIATLTKEREELTKVDSLARLENLPDFRAKYVTGRAEAVEKLTRLAGTDVPVKDLLAVLSKPDNERDDALSELVAGVSEIRKGKIVRMVDDIYDLDAARAKEMEDAQTTIQRRESERSVQEQTARQAHLETARKLFDSTVTKLKDQIDLKPELIEKARKFYEENRDLGAAAEMFIKGVASDEALTGRAADRKKIADLEAELAAFQESEPGVHGGGHNAGGEGDEGLSFREKIKKTRAQGGSVRIV